MLTDATDDRCCRFRRARGSLCRERTHHRAQPGRRWRSCPGSHDHRSRDDVDDHHNNDHAAPGHDDVHHQHNDVHQPAADHDDHDPTADDNDDHPAADNNDNDDHPATVRHPHRVDG